MWNRVYCHCIYIITLWITQRVYAPQCNTSNIQQLPVAAYGMLLGYSTDPNIIYLFGGKSQSEFFNTVYKYTFDLNDYTYALTNTTPTPRFYASSNTVVSISNMIYFVGTTYPVDDKYMFAFNVSTETWIELQNPLKPAISGCLAGNDTHLFFIGGEHVNSSSLFKSLQIYDIESNSWHRDAANDLNAGVTDGWMDGYCAMSNDNLYAFGGDVTYDVYYDIVDTIWKWNAVEKWEVITTTLPHVAGLGTAIAHLDCIYIIGGLRTSSCNTQFCNAYSFDAIYEFNTTQDTFTNTYNMIQALHGVAAGIINNKLYLFGGEVSTDTSGEVSTDVQTCDILPTSTVSLDPTTAPVTSNPTSAPTISTVDPTVRPSSKTPTFSPSTAPLAPSFAPVSEPTMHPSFIPVVSATTSTVITSQTSATNTSAPAIETIVPTNAQTKAPSADTTTFASSLSIHTTIKLVDQRVKETSDSSSSTEAGNKSRTNDNARETFMLFVYMFVGLLMGIIVICIFICCKLCAKKPKKYSVNEKGQMHPVEPGNNRNMQMVQPKVEYIMEDDDNDGRQHVASESEMIDSVQTKGHFKQESLEGERVTIEGVEGDAPDTFNRIKSVLDDNEQDNAVQFDDFAKPKKDVHTKQEPSLEIIYDMNNDNDTEVIGNDEQFQTSGDPEIIGDDEIATTK